MIDNTIMSNEEALDRIKDMMREQNDFLQTRNTYALSMAYEALELQTRKKILYAFTNANSKKRIYGCPTCKQFIPYSERKYCSNCGQRLDWSEMEE